MVNSSSESFVRFPHYSEQDRLCHCEERNDEAISLAPGWRLLRPMPWQRQFVPLSVFRPDTWPNGNYVRELSMRIAKNNF